MNRLPVYFAVSLVVIIAVISGPLVQNIDVAEEPPRETAEFCEAGGNATISVESVPNQSFTLKQRRFGAGAYHLSADETSVSVQEPHGCPIIVYRLTIDALDYFGQRLYFITESTDQELGLRVVEGTFTPSEMTEDAYDGTITIRLRGDRKRTIFQTNVTITVEK